ncbi:hypothetical protein [Methylobacterium iners]|uniref:Uncharacterized protein n=1 Tax=Methylobacterium iners TaxID=418707 RepID=A0ABQ4S525_9HYPH|nr:hypothetical protein [Methylobacterium iners]GJD97675.1 hypothetical protein OCOJLMKI_4908 [Methylobacterium iners]
MFKFVSQPLILADLMMVGVGLGIAAFALIECAHLGAADALCLRDKPHISMNLDVPVRVRS